MNAHTLPLFAGFLLSAGAAQAQSGPDNPLGLTVNHVAMGVASIAVERAFYHDVLGFQVGPTRKRPQYDIQEMRLPAFRLDMIERPGSTRPSPSMGNDKQGWLHITFTVTDVLPIYRKLQAQGVPVTPGRMDGDRIGSVFLTDPEGNRIEIANP